MYRVVERKQGNKYGKKKKNHLTYGVSATQRCISKAIIIHLKDKALIISSELLDQTFSCFTVQIYLGDQIKQSEKKKYSF